MKYSSSVAVSMLMGAASAFAPSRTTSHLAAKNVNWAAPFTSAVVAEMAPVFDQEQFIEESKEMRMKHLEEQAMFALKIAAENYGK